MTPDEVIGFVRRDRQTEDQDELDRQRNQQRRSHKTPRMITHLRGAPASRRRARGRDRRDLPILQDAPQSTLAAQHISLLRSEYSPVTVDPVLITQRREFKPPPLRRDCLFERGDVLRIGRARGERVRYFTKGGLNRLFVLRNRDFFSDARSIELRPMRAASKNRQRNVGTEGPRQCARFEQSGERGARHSVLAG